MGAGALYSGTFRNFILKQNLNHMNLFLNMKHEIPIALCS